MRIKEGTRITLTATNAIKAQYKTRVAFDEAVYPAIVMEYLSHLPDHPNMTDDKLEAFKSNFQDKSKMHDRWALYDAFSNPDAAAMLFQKTNGDHKKVFTLKSGAEAYLWSNLANIDRSLNVKFEKDHSYSDPIVRNLDPLSRAAYTRNTYAEQANSYFSNIKRKPITTEQNIKPQGAKQLNFSFS